jgi:phenylacetate-CoA ligase
MELGELDSAERMSVDELRELQLERLRWTLRHAYSNVPFYRKRFDDAGLHPDDCRELADLARFPVTTKDDLRDNYPYGMFAVPSTEIRRIHASSGTTGQPTVCGYTQDDIDTWAGLMARSIRAAGGRPGDTVHVAYGYGLFTGGLGAHYGAEKLGCAVIPASGGMTSRQVRLIQDLKPRVIMVTPTYMLTLLDEFERAGLDPRQSSLEIGIFGAEPWTEQMRAELEQRAGLHAVDIYGLSEVMGPGIAQECVETKDGLTVWEDHFYPEIIDPVTGERADKGEIVFTSLTKQAMPLVRYRTRDLTRLLPGTARPAFRRMERITGRSDDMIVLRGVNVFPTQIEELLLRVPGLAPHFQLELTRTDRLDELTVHAEARPDASSEQRETAAAELAAAVHDNVGVRVRVQVGDPGTTERSAGKMRRVIDNRENLPGAAVEEQRRAGRGHQQDAAAPDERDPQPRAGRLAEQQRTHGFGDRRDRLVGGEPAQPGRHGADRHERAARVRDEHQEHGGVRRLG